MARDPNQLVPRVVSRCITEIEARGLDFEGIYRISGKYFVFTFLTFSYK